MTPSRIRQVSGVAKNRESRRAPSPRLTNHTTLAVMVEEARAIELGEGEHLSPPVPYRSFVAQARLFVSKDEHEAFFRRLLGDVVEPTAPFGFLDVQGEPTNVQLFALRYYFKY